ncbi:hypothetical protein M9H77_08898 [Catharanthus roseus]|uniref:Uncharacterized protein n=1 Tax=Catharanthus roseus TaxID=4058 RepID=A0ACC0BZ24_CATRO|nr:hypothetical protein M9H77_08898 [Catharanthus roseus]
MAFLFINTNEKPHSDLGVNFDYDLVFGIVRGLYCTSLVPRTRASSDGVDVSNSGEWIHLKRGVDRGGLTQDGQRYNKPLKFRRGTLVQVFERLVPRGTQIS